MFKLLIVLSSLALTLTAWSAQAFVCGRSLSATNAGEQVEQQVGEPGSFECLVDNLVSEQMKLLELVPNEIISTQMVAVDIGAKQGQPEIAYTFHYSIWAEKFDLLEQLWANERRRFETAAAQVSSQIATQVCSSESREAAFFASGGRARVLIKLSSSVGLKKFFYETFIDMEVTDCEAP